MAENKVNIPHVIAAVSAFVGLVLLVVGLATPGWTTEGGLPEGGPGAIQATRGFIVFGTLNLVFGVIFSVTQTIKKPVINPAKCAALMIAGGILADIGAAVFTGYQLITFPGVPFGYSFYLTWAQTIFSIGGGVIILLEERKVTEEDVATARSLNKA
ncbi:PREDICTED: uncharacterized protein LOC109467175 [Branchiostoma belcheri]|uniref:Uncharacterized protein LOC109467175 n=1 Tax=Branchiostoma belcheri TaxID=7741 RepID=A0A6P4Y8B2_BRABE|nr:PREDICTED: uncharacterized protein LOC109467175 [Branchiostoma belcheri]